MSVIAYQDGGWIDLDGLRPDIQFKPLDQKDYYFHVPKTEIVLRLYSRQCGSKEPLGEILTLKGKKIGDVPPFKHPNFKDFDKYYESQIGWVDGVKGNIVSFVIHCRTPQDFRVKLDLDTLTYSKPEFGVR
jgi:hypothetical protein